MEMYAAKMKIPVDIVKQSAQDFQPKAALQSDHMADMDGIVRDAVKLKFLEKPLTKEQIADFIQIPPRKK
jgi:NitT/TauT family transport system substrate-binding protein